MIKKTIKEYYLENPNAKHRVRGLERKLKLSLPSVIRYCKELQKEGILKKIKTDNVEFYTADKINKKYLLEKKLHNLRKIYESGLIEYLKKKLHNPTIILFGSYARGEDIENSDIDIYVETPKKINLEFKKVQFFVYKNIKEIKNKHLANNILNGIVLNNYIEVL